MRSEDWPTQWWLPWFGTYGSSLIEQWNQNLVLDGHLQSLANWRFQFYDCQGRSVINVYILENAKKATRWTIEWSQFFVWIVELFEITYVIVSLVAMSAELWLHPIQCHSVPRLLVEVLLTELQHNETRILFTSKYISCMMYSWKQKYSTPVMFSINSYSKQVVQHCVLCLQY